MHPRRRPFLRGRTANLADTWVATGNLAAGTCCCSCRPSLPVGKHQKAFCEVGCGAQCGERNSFWCPVGTLAAVRKHRSSCVLPSENMTSEEPSLRGALPPQRKVAIASPVSSSFSAVEADSGVRRHVPPRSPGDTGCSAASPLPLCSQSCCELAWAPNPTRTVKRGSAPGFSLHAWLTTKPLQG